MEELKSIEVWLAVFVILWTFYGVFGIVAILLIGVHLDRAADRLMRIEGLLKPASKVARLAIKEEKKDRKAAKRMAKL